jgi:hypothetical protein
MPLGIEHTAYIPHSILYQAPSRQDTYGRDSWRINMIMFVDALSSSSYNDHHVFTAAESVLSTRSNLWSGIRAG